MCVYRPRVYSAPGDQKKVLDSGELELPMAVSCQGMGSMCWYSSTLRC